MRGYGRHHARRRRVELSTRARRRAGLSQWCEHPTGEPGEVGMSKAGRRRRRAAMRAAVETLEPLPGWEKAPLGGGLALPIVPKYWRLARATEMMVSLVRQGSGESGDAGLW